MARLVDKLPAGPVLATALVTALFTGGGCSLEIVDTLAGAGPLAADETEASTLGDEGAEDAGDEAGEEGGQDGGEGPEAPLFDVGGEPAPINSCQFAAQYPSHIGCEFYGLDLDGPGLADADPFGFVVINPLDEPVEITLERHTAQGWTPVQIEELAGEDELVLLPQDAEVHLSGVHPHASFRISGTAPVIVIQATPAAGEGVSASATMLQPIAAWSALNPVAGWRTHQGVGEPSFLGVVTQAPGTSVAIRPVFEIEDPPPEWDQAWVDPQTLLLALEPGELLRLDAGAIDAAEVDHGTSGSTVESGQEHPISVFSAHTCAAIPDYAGSCGHMQEQLSARLVGTHFVAPLLVALDAGLGPDAPLAHERTMIQVVATEPNTEVVFSYHDPQLGEGVELESVLIDPDEPYAVYEHQRDLVIRADRPVVAAAYMTNAELSPMGSPSMVQLAPIEQWSGYHWVWVPEGFETHLIVASAANTEVEVTGLSALEGGAPPPPPSLVEHSQAAGVGQSPWSLHRFALGPGIHRVDSTGPSSVVVAGWRPGDGFAYLGGWGPSLADLGPPG